MAADAPGASGAWERRLHAAWLSRGGLAWALLPFAAVFGALSALRRIGYRRGWSTRHAVGAPVIVVGNLIVGGAGKTPVVLALIESLRRHGYTPGIVSRGYGGSVDGVLDVSRATPPAECGDEPLLLHLRSGAPVTVGRDRVAAARRLLEAHAEVDVVVSDDGLQHLRLARTAQVLVFDERGVGNGWLLPAGPLREPLPRVLPPRTLVVYNAAMPSTPLRGIVARRALRGVLGLAAWRQGGPASMAVLESLRGRPLLAAAGVAQPQRFFEMLRGCGLTITALPLPDHHAFSTLPWPPDTADVVVTEKDAIKLDPSRLGVTRVWVAPLDLGLDPAFDAALLALLPPPGTPHGNATSRAARLPDL